VWITISTSPTFTSVPTPCISLSILPALGAPIVTVALSVMTSTMIWSSATRSPSLTCQATISPSVTPSPMSGSLNSNRAMSLLKACDFEQRRGDAVRERQVFVLQRVRERRVPAGDALGRRLEMQKRLLADLRDHLRAESARARRLVRDQQAAGLLDALD